MYTTFENEPFNIVNSIHYIFVFAIWEVFLLSLNSHIF